MSANSGLIWPSIQVFCISTGAVIGYYVGGFDEFLRVLLAFVVLDYLTALALAAKERRLSSDVGFWGIIKKFLIFAVVALANLIDNEIVYTGDMLRTAVVFFYLANEGLSILENCAGLGLLIPEPVRVAMLKIKNNKGGAADTTAVLTVSVDQIEDIQKLVQIFNNPVSDFDAEPVFMPDDNSVMTKPMFEELTDGGDADGIHE